MATLYTQKSSNIARTYLLITVFLGLVIGIGYFLAFWFNDSVILYIAVGVSIISAFISYWASDKIALSQAHAQQVSEVQAPELHRLIENLAITAGLPKPRVFIIPDQMPNAFATGRNPEHAAIAVTTGLLERLDRSELEGVLAHELSHIGNRDILVMSVAVVLAGIVALAMDFFTRSLFWGGDNDNRAGAIGLLIALALSILAPLFATLMQLAISRRREYLADATGALLTRYPEGLANALRKISSYSGELQTASNATAHLYIANPFGSHSKKGRSWLTELFMTHPPIEKRIEALLNQSV